MKNTQPWHEQLAQWMGANAWTAEELARHVKTSARSVYRWRSGESVPGPEQAVKLSEVGAPSPPAQKRGSPSHEPLRAQLDRIEQKLDRLLERTTR